MIVVACLKLVELRAGVDALTGAVVADPASASASAADESALEWALRIAEDYGSLAEVVAISVGGPEAEPMLRRAVAAGAARAVRVAVPADPAEVPSRWVADAIAQAIVALTPDPSDREQLVVCCGDASVDRGSGSVPAYVADRLGLAQALGLVGLSLPGDRDDPAEPASSVRRLEVDRRLDGGRRERLWLEPPYLVSVEAGTARLRRASLQGSLASLQSVVGQLAVDAVSEDSVELVGVEAFRPRTRVVAPPPASLGPRRRIEALTGALHERPAARHLVLNPAAAADEVLATLADWGELPEPVMAQWLAATSETAAP